MSIHPGALFVIASLLAASPLCGADPVLISGGDAPDRVPAVDRDDELPRGTAVDVAEIAPEEDAGEVLWRQVVLEDGRVALIRDRLEIGETVSVSRDAFVIEDGVVVNRLPLDADGSPIEQVVLQLKAQPLTGLSAAEPGEVMAAVAWLERPRPDPTRLPPSVVGEGAEPMLSWQRVRLSDARTVVFWDREAPRGGVVRDAFMLERETVARHLVVPAERDPVAIAQTVAFEGEVVGPLEPATEANVLVVADYLDDSAKAGVGVLSSDVSLEVFDPGDDDGGVVSPSGGIGGP